MPIRAGGTKGPEFFGFLQGADRKNASKSRIAEDSLLFTVAGDWYGACGWFTIRAVAVVHHVFAEYLLTRLVHLAGHHVGPFPKRSRKPSLGRKSCNEGVSG